VSFADAGEVPGGAPLAYVARRVVPAEPAPPEVFRPSLARRVGTILLGLWALIGAGLALYLWSAFDAGIMARYGPSILEGLLVTLQLVGVSIVLGAALGLIVAAGRLSSNMAVQAVSYAYVYFFRGTPLLAQIFLVYYGAGEFRPALEAVGLWDFFRDAFNCALFTFTLNTAAYQGEIYRGAIAAVPRGQWEAGRSLGLHRTIIFVKIVAPQAMITALRPLGNEIVFMIKGSAVASIVTVLDLMGETRLAFSRTFDFQVYLWAAILYFILVEALRRVWDVIEARLVRHLQPATSGAPAAAVDSEPH
jgi:polar amino acid transport system permease protein